MRSVSSRGLAVAAALVLFSAAGTAGAVTDQDRADAYKEFRTAFDARRYADALPLAERVVALTEQQYGPDDRALANPLANLGTTYYRMGRLEEAEKQYQRGIHILEEKGGGATEPRLLAPLHGLGAVYYRAGQYAQASTMLKRAVDLSRNLDGLFNPAQLQIIEPLIASYVELGDVSEAEKEHQYAFRVSENALGRNDLRLLGPIDRYARWFEFVGRYASARALHARALAIAEGVGKAKDPRHALEPLLGIARTYRQEFLTGTAEPVAQAPDPFANPTGMIPTSGDPEHLNPDGERALRYAIGIIEATKPVNRRDRGQTLVELGDWYLAGGAPQKAVEFYRDAWKDLSASGTPTRPLDAPRQLAYRPPSASVVRSKLDPAIADEQRVEIAFTVTREGKTADVHTVSSEASDNLTKSVLSAVKRAKYTPRFQNGEPVDTPDVRLIERIAVKRPPPGKGGGGAGGPGKADCYGCFDGGPAATRG